MMKKRGEASDIRIDDLPLKLDSEIQNMAMHGTVSTGKSTLMRKILKQLRDRGDLVIIYDKGCTFVEDFYDESRDKVLNALDSRCPNWDLWEECRSIAELENASTTLIPASSGEDPFWQGSARTIFAEGAERMRKDEDRSYNKFLRTLLAIKLDQLRAFLAGTPASTLVDGKIEKTAISIRSVLTNYVKALRYLQGIDRPGREKFTIREWMKGQTDKSKNGWLFITSDEQNHESLKPLISLWLSIAATSLLAMGPNRQRRVWFFYDELASLHKLSSLPRIISEARKFGGCFVLGFQNIAQMEEIYGPKAAAGLFDLLNTKFFFRSPSAEIAQFVEKDLGETRRKKFNEQTSFGHEQVRDGISFGKEEERVTVVTYSDVQKLNDLQCYVTLPGDYPVVKLSMSYEAMAEATNSLVLQGEDGTRLTLKVTQLDGSWSLYRSRTLEVSEGDRVRALGRELKGAIKAKEQFTLAGLENGAVRLRSGDRELRLPTERAVKLTHDYVEGTGAGTSASRTVLAAVGPRGLNKQALNALAQSGSDIRIYTPLAPEQAARKVESVSAVRLASDQVRQSTGEANLDTAIQASRDRLMSDAEQAVSLAIPRAQQGQVHLSEITLLSEAVKSGQPLADVRTEIARQVNSGELIQLDSVSGAGNRVLVPRVAYEMEKTIIRHIAEGKDAVQPLMALTPASVLAGLTAGQREATRTVLENTDRFMAIQGYAGVGKTTQFRAVMGALNTLSESVRPQVIGLGPTHRAVHEMREAGVDARTLASFLSETRLAIQAGETPDFRNVLFLTDESSMVGNRDMAELYQLVTAGGGRMVSSGDTAQLQAISTGQPFRLVQQRSAIDTVVMQEIVRQTPALRPAIESIIAGQVDTSLRQVDDVSPQQVPRQEGAWVPGNSVMEIRAPKKDQEQDTPAADEQTLTPEQLSLVRTDIIEAIRDDWMGRTPEAQLQTLVVAELNADRHAINDAIHAARHEKGDTGAEERTFTVLEPLRVPDNALRAAETFAEYTGAVAMMNERYWTVAEVDTQDAVVTLRNADGESVLISPQQNTAQDISLFTPRDLTISHGDRVRFTRSDNDRG